MLRKKNIVLIGAACLFLISGAIYYSGLFRNGSDDTYTSGDYSYGVASVLGPAIQAGQPTESGFLCFDSK